MFAIIYPALPAVTRHKQGWSAFALVVQWLGASHCIDSDTLPLIIYPHPHVYGYRYMYLDGALLEQIRRVGRDSSTAAFYSTSNTGYTLQLGMGQSQKAAQEKLCACFFVPN